MPNPGPLCHHNYIVDSIPPRNIDLVHMPVCGIFSFNSLVLPWSKLASITTLMLCVLFTHTRVLWLQPV
jgi:hypothetical protein